MAALHATAEKEMAAAAAAAASKGALGVAAPSSVWCRMLSEASTSLPEEDGSFSRQATGSGGGAAAAGFAANVASVDDDDEQAAALGGGGGGSVAAAERDEGKAAEADLGATASVSLALVSLAAVGSLWLQPAAFVWLAALGLTMASVVWLTGFPLGVPGPSAASLEGLGDDDCVPDACREADFAENAAAALLALLAGAAGLAYWLGSPLTAAALAALSVTVLVGSWLAGLLPSASSLLPPPPPPLAAARSRVAGVAGGGGGGAAAAEGAPGRAGEGKDEGGPDDSEEADAAALVSVAAALATLSAVLAVVWPSPAACGACAVLGLAALAAAWLREMPHEAASKRLAESAAAAIGGHAAAQGPSAVGHGEAEEGDCPPENSKEADRAALLSVSLAAGVLATATLAGLVLPSISIPGPGEAAL